MERAFAKRRRSVRLRGFDYSQPGSYFITICTAGKKRILGTVQDRKMILSRAGKVVRDAWFDLPRRFPSVGLGEFVVMPNHVHAVVGLAQPIHPAAKGAPSSAPTTGKAGFAHPRLGDVIRVFKSLSAIEVNRVLGHSGEALWQRSYHEHIIRHGKDYDQIRKYIADNPILWDQDPDNFSRRTAAESPVFVGALLAALSYRMTGVACGDCGFRI